MREVDYEDWNILPQEDLGKEEGSNSAFTFLSLVVFLTGFGLVMLYSASYDEAIRHGLPHYYFLQRQVVFVLLAGFASFVLNRIPWSWYDKAVLPLLIVAVALLVLTLLPGTGSTTLGARRWLRLGPLSIQPSEFAKVALILFLASWHARPHGWWAGYLLPLLVTALLAALILLERDFSTMVLVLFVSLAVNLAAGLPVALLLLALATIAVPCLIAIFIMPYRIQRILTFLFPGADASGAGYQVDAALEAIRRGGLFGVGIGNGTYKLGLLPEVQNDFIFANMCEELGLVWMGFLLCLFLFYAFLGYRTYRRIADEDPFSGYLVFGITTLVVSQAVVNIAVVLGLLPPTGIPLPFFSQGGSNIFVIICSSSVAFRIMLAARPHAPSAPNGKTLSFPTGGRRA